MGILSGFQYRLKKNNANPFVITSNITLSFPGECTNLSRFQYNNKINDLQSIVESTPKTHPGIYKANINVWVLYRNRWNNQGIPMVQKP